LPIEPVPPPLARESISEETNSNILIFETVASVVAGIVLVYGFGDYFVYQMNSHKKDFSFLKFILGSHICKSLSKK
jgi:hypothetical protein